VHLLKGQGLHTSSRETLKNPALVLFLSFLDFLLHSSNNDIVLNVVEVGESLYDLLVVLVLRFVSDGAEDVTSRNMFPGEEVSERARVLFTTTARRTEEEHSLDYRKTVTG
jgi:hypothetical protein